MKTNLIATLNSLTANNIFIYRYKLNRINAMERLGLTWNSRGTHTHTHTCTYTIVPWGWKINGLKNMCRSWVRRIDTDRSVRARQTARNRIARVKTACEICIRNLPRERLNKTRCLLCSRRNGDLVEFGRSAGRYTIAIPQTRFVV